MCSATPDADSQAAAVVVSTQMRPAPQSASPLQPFGWKFGEHAVTPTRPKRPAHLAPITRPPTPSVPLPRTAAAENRLPQNDECTGAAPVANAPTGVLGGSRTPWPSRKTETFTLVMGRTLPGGSLEKHPWGAKDLHLHTRPFGTRSDTDATRGSSGVIAAHNSTAYRPRRTMIKSSDEAVPLVEAHQEIPT